MDKAGKQVSGRSKYIQEESSWTKPRRIEKDHTHHTANINE